MNGSKGLRRQRPQAVAVAAATCQRGKRVGSKGSGGDLRVLEVLERHHGACSQHVGARMQGRVKHSRNNNLAAA